MKDKAKSGCDSLAAHLQTITDPRQVDEALVMWQKQRRTWSRAGLLRRMRDQAKARDAMYAQVHRVYGQGDDGAALLQRALERKASSDRQADLLMINAKPKDKKRFERARAEMTRNSALARLLIKGQITKDMYEAGVELRQLWIAVAPGMSAIDFSKPKVDGGGPHRDTAAGMHLGSETRLKQLIIDSGMGVEAAEIVCMVCALDMLPTLCAIEVEQNDSARRDGTCTRETLTLVRYQLRSGLQLVWNLMKKRPASRKGLQSMQVWLSDHMLATHQQSRPETTERKRG